MTTEVFPLQDRIRLRAYRIWEREGRPEGRAEEHWRQAEYEVSQEEPEEPEVPDDPEYLPDPEPPGKSPDQPEEIPTVPEEVPPLPGEEISPPEQHIRRRAR